MGPRCGPNLDATGDLPLRDLGRRHSDPPRWLWGLWLGIVVLNVGLLVVFVALLDPPLIALACRMAANLIIVLTKVGSARQSEAGRRQPLMHAPALP